MKIGYVNIKKDPTYLADTVRAGRIVGGRFAGGDPSSMYLHDTTVAESYINNVKVYAGGASYSSTPTVTFDMPHTNILDGVDFENWCNGTTSAPAFWTLTGTSATVAQNTTDHRDTGFSSASLTRVGNDCSLNQTITNPRGMAYWQGRTVIYGCWVHAVVADRAYVSIYDGVNTVRSTAHPGDSNWYLLQVKMTIDSSATQLTVYNEVRTGNTVAQFDDAAFMDVTAGHTQATGVAKVSGAAITRIDMIDPGYGYTVSMDTLNWNPWPRVTVTDSTGSGFKGIAYVPVGMQYTRRHGTLDNTTHYIMRDKTMRGCGYATGGRMGCGNILINQPNYPISVSYDITDTTYDDPFNPLVPIMSWGSVDTAWALMSDGTLWMTGNNAEYQLGLAGDVTVREMFTRIPASIFGGYPVVKFKCSYNTGSYHYEGVLNANQDWYRWGYNANYNLGDGTTTVIQTPTLLSVTDKICDFCFVGANQLGPTMLLDSASKVLFAGDNAYGEASNGTITQVHTFSYWNTAGSTPITNVIQIRGGGAGTSTGYHTCWCLKDNGNLYGAGYGVDGQLGNNTILSTGSGYATTVKVSGGATLGNIVAHEASQHPGGSYSFSFCKTMDQKLYAWGDNTGGQLGLGDVVQRSVATETATAFRGSEYVRRIALCGGSNTGASAIMLSNGRIGACGYNGYGNLGDNSATTPRNSWLVPKGFNNRCMNVFDVQWLNRGVDTYYSLQVQTKDGNVYGTGYNVGGYLCDGTVTTRNNLLRVHF